MFFSRKTKQNIYTAHNWSEASDVEKLGIWHKANKILKETKSTLERAAQQYQRATDLEDKARKEVQKITK